MDKVKKDGQETKIPNPVYTSYKIENYDGKTLQLFHIDEQVTICYVKQ
ncbi:hypothetical protein BTJ44_00636 [Bacillus mycoides]|nr:hypothetical protein BTJ44_00636 [Bacillus mycoides]